MFFRPFMSHSVAAAHTCTKVLDRDTARERERDTCRRDLWSLNLTYHVSVKSENKNQTHTNDKC